MCTHNDVIYIFFSDLLVWMTESDKMHNKPPIMTSAEVNSELSSFGSSSDHALKDGQFVKDSRRSLKVNQRRTNEHFVRTNSISLLIKFPALVKRNPQFSNSKSALDSKQHSMHSAVSRKSQLIDYSQMSSYSSQQNANKDEKNFPPSLGIKISISETSSTSSQKTKAGAQISKTNFNGLVFVALRQEEPVFQSFQKIENSNVIYGPLILLIKPERDGLVLNDEDNRIKVEIDFPKMHHQSLQQMNMRKLLPQKSVGKAHPLCEKSELSELRQFREIQDFRLRRSGLTNKNKQYTDRFTEMHSKAEVVENNFTEFSILQEQTISAPKGINAALLPVFSMLNMFFAHYTR